MIAHERGLRYALVLPEGWHRIRLGETRLTHRDIDDLLRRQLQGLGEVPQIRRQLRSHLREQASAAQSAGGIELFFSMMLAGPLSVAASLLVCLPPPDPLAVDLKALHDLLAARYAEVPCEMVDLPSGPALRRSYFRHQSASLDAIDRKVDAPPGATVPEVDTFRLEFHMMPPGVPSQFLGLYFSSPLAQLHEPLTELFDAAAHTLRWFR